MKLCIRNVWVIKFLSICIDLILSLWSETHSSVKNSNIHRPSPFWNEHNVTHQASAPDELRCAWWCHVRSASELQRLVYATTTSPNLKFGWFEVVAEDILETNVMTFECNHRNNNILQTEAEELSGHSLQTENSSASVWYIFRFSSAYHCSFLFQCYNRLFTVILAGCSFNERVCECLLPANHPSRNIARYNKTISWRRTNSLVNILKNNKLAVSNFENWRGEDCSPTGRRN